MRLEELELRHVRREGRERLAAGASDADEQRVAEGLRGGVDGGVLEIWTEVWTGERRVPSSRVVVSRKGCGGGCVSGY